MLTTLFGLMATFAIPYALLDAIIPFLEESPSLETRLKIAEQLGKGWPFRIALIAIVGGVAVLLTMMIDRKCKELSRIVGMRAGEFD